MAESVLTLNKSRLVFTPLGGTQYVRAESTMGVAPFPDPSIAYETGGPSGWIGIEKYPTLSNVTEYDITVSPSEYNRVLKATIYFDDGEGGTAQLEVNQYPVIRSIWEDMSYNPGFTPGDDYVYRLKIDGDVIYEGMTVCTSANIPEPINVSRIVESYLTSSSFNGSTANNIWIDLKYICVDFYKVTSGTETYVNSFLFCNDWSNDIESYSDQDVILNDPINRKVNSAMRIPFCLYNAEGVTWTMDNVTSSQTYPLSLPTQDYPFGMICKSFTNTNTNQLIIKKSGTPVLTYNYGYCGQGALYYRNRYGGWDCFLLEGNIKKSDTYTKEQYSQVQDNRSTETWGKKTSRVNITTTYETTTGWLSDDESDRLVYHLISSPEIYFQPFVSDPHSVTPTKYVSVNLTNTTAEYKKFRNGRSMINYTLTFEDSKTKQIVE